MLTGRPSLLNSFGIPILIPLTELFKLLRKLSFSFIDEVESLGSCPAIISNKAAASSTVLVIGPAWSSDDAKAMMPHLETLP